MEAQDTTESVKQCEDGVKGQSAEGVREQSAQVSLAFCASSLLPFFFTVTDIHYSLGHGQRQTNLQHRLQVVVVVAPATAPPSSPSPSPLLVSFIERSVRSNRHCTEWHWWPCWCPITEPFTEDCICGCWPAKNQPPSLTAFSLKKGKFDRSKCPPLTIVDQQRRSSHCQCDCMFRLTATAPALAEQQPQRPLLYNK